MRVARPQPTPLAIPTRATYAAIAVAVLAAVLGVVRAGVPFTGGADARMSAPSLTMADSFGIGGLASITARDQDAASAIAHNDVVTYYGSPRTPSMGILGQHDPETVADLLSERAARFDALNGDRGVIPALHLVYAIAQPDGRSDDDHLRYVDDRTVRQFLELARRRGFILVLDLQIGHSDSLTEVRRIAPYLEEPDVVVALDPEFALPAGIKPGQAVGSISADDINAVQWYLAGFTSERRLPRKLLIVHQFQAEMIRDAGNIARLSNVDLIIDMDGYGPADIKAVKYQRYGAAPYSAYGGIKIFLEHDPDPLTEAQLLDITPRPAIFVYQ
jgi:hypothetical protein